MRLQSLRRACALLVVVVVAGCGGNPELIGTKAGSAGGHAGTTSVIDGGGEGGRALFGEGGPNGSGGTTGVLSDACVTDACRPDFVCGDGKITGPEECDDGNSIPGDGCSGICLIEPGYTCPAVKAPCIYTVAKQCGDGKIQGNEGCDDGNAQNGDGCSADCSVEQGYSCAAPGKACVHTTKAYCGNGIVDFGEQCDDGDKADAGTANGDGCSSTCQIEPGFTCPTPGSPCVVLEYCGDGKVQSTIGETCDDGNAIPGDGCSGVCTLEPGYSCPVVNQACVNLWVCGNGKVDPGESCDDGNTVGSPVDGCTVNCSVVPGWTCPKGADGTGGQCHQVTNACGDAILGPGEECDDGNTTDSPIDGCSPTCTVDTGWTCPKVGTACQLSEYCGNGVVDLDIGETCDDKNTKGGDGCSPLCKTEGGYSCPTAGSPCVSNVRCGDGKIGGDEQCDDGNKTSNDGCDSSCQLEAGWLCAVPAARCVAKQCGDGITVGAEQCDDGAAKSGDGCSPTCKLEPGYACTTTAGSPSSCHKTVCGDGTNEGFEQCDDGNLIPYDGCSPTCTIEPKCASGECTAVCGDGFKFDQEQCDDGNTTDNDGCSSKCTFEPGYVCTVQTLAPPSELVIPILFRDFLYKGTTVPGPGHPDFQAYNGAAQGIVNSTLDAQGKPTLLNGHGVVTSASSFYDWYHDKQLDGTDNPYEQLVYLDANNNPMTLTLGGIGGGAYSFQSSAFFKIDNLGWNATSSPQTDKADDGNYHNFSFSSEFRYQFTYQGGEILNFTGDDDVWVFINGQLAVDIGGVHGATNGNITLDAAAATKLGLVQKSMYEIALFQAERHTVASNYKLTLTGFVHAITQCNSVCGDGIVTQDEVCDDGKNDGSYGGCMPGCQARGPYCGDVKVTKPPESCDDGTNLGSYGVQNVCAPGCVFAPYCGDSVVSNGESCDEGSALNGTGYGHCTASCTLGQRCGDTFVNGPEQCDDGINNGSTGSRCAADCTLKCGNDVVDPGEACDNGTNDGSYGTCNSDCTLAPHCGDGIKNGTEACDDGKNDGSYGTCTPTCGIAGYCGDKTVQTPPESCDLGSAVNSSTAYGKDLCTNRCTPAPFCGDKAVDGADQEVCDDGVNSGLPGSCTTDCKGFVPLTTCGDSKIESPEQCDDGTANNGTIGSKCDAHCRIKCGNGFKDTGEQCDNGVNTGAYGTCTSTCTLAGYCGDGTKNGPEVCDNGARNVDGATAYGPGLCEKAACVLAPFCGDGRIQTQYGEECDGGQGCTAGCQLKQVQ